MPKWALIFFVTPLVAGGLGFTNLAFVRFPSASAVNTRSFDEGARPWRRLRKLQWSAGKS